MSDSLHDRAFNIFVAACELKGDARQRYLDEACANDAALRKEVVSLLAHDREDDALSAVVAKGAQSVVDDGLAEQLPERIDRYRVLRIIGEGGMGTVYEAVQDGTERSVALKIVRGGSTGMLRRFSREIKLLGKLRHPGIAQIYDSGTAIINGRPVPYFAMEFIRGQSLTDYATANRLDLAARLDLIARIADAVQFAHQYGVIHRDLKPGNILVEDHALTSSIDGPASAAVVGIAMPKILDFGVARALDVDMQTLQTDVGQIIGTLAYMSPEQVSARPDAIDTRSDVYALGVVAYELLTAKRPIDVSGRPIHEAIRQIQEQVPSRPGALDRKLHGDIETIILKAMEKEPQRRYQSAAELAADIRRYLADEPIVARQASSMYQLRKFARRNRALVAAFSIALAALVVGAVAASWQAVVATQARNRAERETEKLAATHDFLIHEMLLGVTPDEKMGRDIALVDVLRNASERVDKALKGKPEVEASVRHSLGEVYILLGDYDAAQDHLKKSIALRERVLGPEHLDTLRTLSLLCSALKRQGRLDEADPLQLRAYEGLRQALGDEHPETLDAKNNLGTLRSRQKRYDEAAKIHRQILDVRLRICPADDPKPFESMHNLAFALESLSQLNDAAQLYDRAVEGKLRTEGPRRPSTLYSMMNRDDVLRKIGKPEEALVSTRKTLALSKEVLGPSHANVATPLGQLSRLLIDRGQMADLREAEGLLKQAIDIQQHTLVPNHPQIGANKALLGQCLMRQGRYRDAEPLLIETHHSLSKRLGPDAKETQAALNQVVDLYQREGRAADAQVYRIASTAAELQPASKP